MIYKIIPDNTTATHVYGHQDRKYKPLSLQEYLNTIADFIATHNKTKPIQQHPPRTFAIYVDNTYITFNIPKFLRKHSFYKAVATSMKKKYHWSDETFDMIYWEAYDKCVHDNMFDTQKNALNLSIITLR